MNAVKISFQNTVDVIKNYIETRLDIAKLDAHVAVSRVISSIISWFIISALLFLILILLSIGLSIAVGYVTGQMALGFTLVGLLYVCTGLVIYNKRSRWLQVPISNMIIEDISDDNENK